MADSLAPADWARRPWHLPRHAARRSRSTCSGHPTLWAPTIPQPRRSAGVRWGGVTN